MAEVAVTEITLLILGALGTLLGGYGLFQQFGDDWTPVLLQFAAAGIWGLFGMASFDVTLSHRLCCEVSRAIMPLVYLGIGLAGVMALFALDATVSALQGTASESRSPFNT